MGVLSDTVSGEVERLQGIVHAINVKTNGMVVLPWVKGGFEAEEKWWKMQMEKMMEEGGHP